MRFGAPAWLLLAAFVPVVAGLVLWSARRSRTLAARFGARAAALIEGRSRTRAVLRRAFLLAAAGLLALAASRPQWGRSEQEVRLVGVDVLLAIDSSFSMDARDVPPSRMERARYVASALTEELAGNRVGILVFAGSAFTQCPLTHDLGAVRTLLAGVATGAVESPGTSLSAVVEEAARAFDRQESRHRALVLLTDGQQDDLGAAAIPEIAALARDAGITVFAVGVGTPGGATIPVETGSGPTLMRDAAGNPIVSRLDISALSELAGGTGGAFHEVSVDDREIGAVVRRIQELESGELGASVSRRREERFWIPAGLAAALLIAQGFLPVGVRRRQREVATA